MSQRNFGIQYIIESQSTFNEILKEVIDNDITFCQSITCVVLIWLSMCLYSTVLSIPKA